MAYPGVLGAGAVHAFAVQQQREVQEQREATIDGAIMQYIRSGDPRTIGENDGSMAETLASTIASIRSYLEAEEAALTGDRPPSVDLELSSAADQVFQLARMPANAAGFLPRRQPAAADWGGGGGDSASVAIMESLLTVRSSSSPEAWRRAYAIAHPTQPSCD
jgi:hypothetical protein